MSEISAIITRPFRIRPSNIREIAPIGLGFLVVGIYLYAALTASAHTQLWLDEVLAVWVARLPSFADIVRAMWRGAEYSPPTYELILHHIFMSVGQSGALAARILSIYSVLGASIALMVISSKYMRLGPACLTMACLLNSSMFVFAIQSKQYALLCFITAMAFLIWDADFGGRRWLKTTLLWIALSLAVSLHFFGVLVIGAIAVAELLQLLVARRFRGEVWVALTLSVAVVIAWVPYFLHLSHFNSADYVSPAFYGRPNLRQFEAALLTAFIGDRFRLGWLPILAGALVALALQIWSGVTRPASPAAEGRGKREPTSFCIILAALAAIPVMGFGVSVVVTHAFSERYISSLALLPALLAGLVVDRSPRPNLLSAALILLICPVLATRAHGGFHEPATALTVIQALPTSEKIVVGEAKLYIELMEAAPPEVRARLVYLRNKPGEILPDPTNEHLLLQNTRDHPGLVTLDQTNFTSAFPRFYVLARPSGSVDGTTPSLSRGGFLKQPPTICGAIFVFHGDRRANPGHGPQVSCPLATVSAAASEL